MIKHVIKIMMQSLKEVNVCIPAVPKSFFFFFLMKTFKAELFHRRVFHGSGCESMGFLQQQEITEAG